MENRVKQAETLLRGVRLGMINDKNLEKKTYGLTSLDLKLVNDDSVLTMGVDGVHLFYNVDFVLGLEKDKAQEAKDKLNMLKSHLSQEEYENQLYRIEVWYGTKDRKTFEFLFRHEIDHIIYEHMQHIGTRDPQLWNFACDHRINNDVVSSWLSNNTDYEKQLPILKGACCDKKYRNKEWTSFKIYDDLIDSQEKEPKGNQQHSTVDSHIYSDGDSKGQNKSDRVTRDILGLPANFNNKAKDDSEINGRVDPKVAAERIKNSFVDAAKQVGLGSNNQTLEAIKASKPIINWKKVLRKNLAGLNKVQHDPKRISRRIHGITSTLHDRNYINKDVHLFSAGKKPEPTIKVHCFFDTSGSISNKERSIMLSETFGIMSQYNQFEIIVACWGTNFIENSLKTFNKQNKNELKDYSFIGGGGTDPNCLLPFISKQKLKNTDKIIVFTDSYFSLDKSKWKKYEKYCIFVSTVKNMQHVYSGLNIKYIEYDKHL